MEAFNLENVLLEQEKENKKRRKQEKEKESTEREKENVLDRAHKNTLKN